MATSRIPDSFAEFVKFLGNLTGGLEVGAKNDSFQKQYFASISKSFRTVVKLDQDQESFKSRMKEATRKLESELAVVRESVGRIVSYLEARYGKKGGELIRYGLAPRRAGGGRKSAPVAGTPAPGAAAQ